MNKPFRLKPATPIKKIPRKIMVIYAPEVKKFNPPLRMFQRKIWGD